MTGPLPCTGVCQVNLLRYRNNGAVNHSSGRDEYSFVRQSQGLIILSRVDIFSRFGKCGVFARGAYGIAGVIPLSFSAASVAGCHEDPSLFLLKCRPQVGGSWFVLVQTFGLHRATKSTLKML